MKICNLFPAEKCVFLKRTPTFLKVQATSVKIIWDVFRVFSTCFLAGALKHNDIAGAIQYCIVSACGEPINTQFILKGGTLWQN